MDNRFERVASGVVARSGFNFIERDGVEYELVTARVRVQPKVVLRPGDVVVVMRKVEVPPDEFTD